MSSGNPKNKMMITSGNPHMKKWVTIILVTKWWVLDLLRTNQVVSNTPQTETNEIRKSIGYSRYNEFVGQELVFVGGKV